MTALLDTNIILDVILDRPPFVQDSGAVWRACDLGRFSGYISGITPPTVYYVVERIRGRGIALSAIDKCLAAFEISPVYRETLEAARRMNGPDFEDDIHIACAITSFVDCIVTRDPAGFAASPVPVYSPATFVAML